MAATCEVPTAVQKYTDYDEETRRRLLCGDLSEETKLPRELLERFYEMWSSRSRPFFTDVDEAGLLSRGSLSEVVRNLGVHSEIICLSISRVIALEGPTVDFSGFVRGYAQLHARTLKEALPFAFKVFDLDDDGRLCPTEFQQMLTATLDFKKLDGAAVKRVLAAPPSQEGELGGLTSDQFRYFASLSAETILATCGFLLHVTAFYVPPMPLGPIAEEREEEAAAAAARAAKGPLGGGTKGGAADGAASVSAAAGGEGGGANAANPFEDEEFLSALESLRTTPEERAERQKTRGNEALRSKEPNALSHAVDRYTEGLDEHPRDQLLLATLLNNRAAAQLMLKNWGRALADSRAALEVPATAPGAGAPAVAAGATARGAPAAKRVGGVGGAEAAALATAAADRALGAAAALKASRRGASAALRLERLADARVLCEEGRQIALSTATLTAASSAAASVSAASIAAASATALSGGNTGGGGDGGGGGVAAAAPVAGADAAVGDAAVAAGASAAGEDVEVESLFRQLALKEGEVEAARLAALAKAEMEARLATALKRRGLSVADFTDESMRQQCVGAHSGAHTWYDAAADEVHWPVMFLYPETSMSDYIQDMSERGRLAEHFLEMFGAAAEHAPPWDHERKYAAAALQPYVCFEGGDGKPAVRPLDAEASLGPQLVALCRNEGYAVQGIPILHVVVRGSPFEKEFLRRDGRA